MVVNMNVNITDLMTNLLFFAQVPVLPPFGVWVSPTSHTCGLPDGDG